MAKGNLGNILQHFVAVRAADVLLKLAAPQSQPVVYVDLFTMAPWEPLDTTATGGAAGEQRRDFIEQFRRLPGRAEKEDIVAAAFKGAAMAEPNEAKGTYPNTAVLMRTAFPTHPWDMYLHEICDTTRDRLHAWTKRQSIGKYDIRKDWRPPASLQSIPTACSPVFLMLDPYKVVTDDHRDAGEAGYLPEKSLHGIVGQPGLALLGRTDRIDAPPTLLTIFSYSDTDPDVPDAILRRVFPPTKWNIERVRTKAYRVFTHDSIHQAWIIGDKLPHPILGSDFQEEWNRWLRSR